MVVMDRPPDHNGSARTDAASSINSAGTHDCFGTRNERHLSKHNSANQQHPPGDASFPFLPHVAILPFGKRSEFTDLQAVISTSPLAAGRAVSHSQAFLVDCVA